MGQSLNGKPFSSRPLSATRSSMRRKPSLLLGQKPELSTLISHLDHLERSHRTLKNSIMSLINHDHKDDFLILNAHEENAEDKDDVLSDIDDLFKES